jgi:twitching motility protein PilT
MSDELNALLVSLIRPQVSDIFVTSGKRPCFRRNGEIVTSGELAPVSASAVDAWRDSVLDDVLRAEYLTSGGADAAVNLNGRRCRVNFMSTLNGPALVLRPISEGGVLDFEKLGLPAKALEKLCAKTRGIVFCAGGTGSGKTTTMNAMINFINRHYKRHILTLEDPIEYLHEDHLSLVNQRELRNGDFGAAMRNAVRENPDVIVLGEMRDAGSVRAALNAALTGHLVLTTVHCTDCVALTERLLGFFGEEERRRIAADLALSLEAVIAQRMLPGVSGGMVPAVELMLGTPTVRKHVEQCAFDALAIALADGGGNGMIALNSSLFALVNSDQVRRQTALDASDDPEELELRFSGIRRGSTKAGAESVLQRVLDLNINDLFHSAVKMKASDVVLSHNMPPLMRINGEMRAVDLPPLSTGDIRRLLFSVIDKRRRAVFEERRELDFSLSVPVKMGDKEKLCRFRLNTFFQRGTPALVARVLDDTIPPPDALGIPSVMLDLVRKRQGLILVTGPTGSGKSTTLASLLDFVNHRLRSHIITIEDPIEFVYANDCSVIEQREVHADTLSFAGALRAALRQAPDIIMVGEMRDPETIAAALTAAETGHLVLGTIHTNSAAQTVDRVIDSFPQNMQNQIRQQFAGSLLAVVSQRLLRRADGQGRVAAFEIMVATTAIRALIRDCRGHQIEATMETGWGDGMQTMRRALEELVKSGAVTEEEANTLTDVRHQTSGASGSSGQRCLG